MRRLLLGCIVAFLLFPLGNGLAEESVFVSEIEYENISSQIEDEYFIILKAGEEAKKITEEEKETLLREVSENVERLGGQVLDTYENVFVGLLVRMRPALAYAYSAQEPQVHIENNGMVKLYGAKDSVSWGIDRVDQRKLPLDSKFDVRETGKGAHAYIIDSGLRVTHEDFKGRLGKGFSAIKKQVENEDCDGHGTHVAGTVAGRYSGIAKEATIHPVRVFGCKPYTSWDVILKAIEWVVKNHQSPAVVNMSLGGEENETLDLAVKSMIDAGISVVVAAGNEDIDACKNSPSRLPEAVTVGASNTKDQKFSSEFGGGSNDGSCVDIIAPGVDVSSAGSTKDNTYETLTGTSMASPHVAGALLLLRAKYPKLSPAEVEKILFEHATKNVLKGFRRGTPNRLLYVGSF